MEAPSAGTPSRGDFRSRARDLLPWFGLAGVFFCALAVRLPFALAADFPLGDGGMFAQIIDDIRAHGFALPAFTSYNGGSIPLCYPPLGFYLAALSGVPTLKALLWLPLALSVLVPCSLFLLARTMLDSEAGALSAGLAAALLPVPYWFGLEGGGLTRSLGLLLMVLAATCMLWARKKPSAPRLLLAGATLAASMASHPETMLLMPLLVATVVLAEPCWANVRAVAKVVAIAAVALLPWLVVVLWGHGPAPWIAAFRSGGGSGSLGLALEKIRAWWFTAEEGPSPFAVMALLGLPVALLRRQTLTLVWLLAPVFLVPRNCRFWSAPAIALLVGLTVSALVFPGLDRAARSSRGGILAKSVVLIGLLIYGLVLAQRWTGRLLLLSPIPEEDRQALTWLAGRVAPGERAAAIDCEPSGLSGFSEWAPYLAHAENVVVPQGREWLGDGGLFAERATSLRQALVTNSQALQAWLHREPAVRWLVVGSLSAGDPRLRRTLSDAAKAGTVRLGYQRGGATVWQSASNAAAGR